MTVSRPIHVAGLSDQTPEQRAQDLANLPLFAGFSSNDLLYVAQRAEPVPFVPGMTLIRQGEVTDEVNYLYVVGEGTLLQSGTGPDGIPWLDRVLQRGDVFGRYALLLGIPQETTVTARDYGYLYRIAAPDVSLILARWPHLRERLIPTQRIHRLRALPLFSALPDEHIRRLADHVVEKTLSPGEVHRGTPDHPHLWVIGEGQVILAASEGTTPPHFEVAEPLSLELATVGYVFVDGAIPVVGLSPRQVRAVSRTVLYGLSASTFEALLERFETPGEEYGRSVLVYTRFPDVAALLGHVRPFQRLPVAWRQHLRGFVGWIFTPRSQVIVEQGRRGTAMYLLERGEAVIRAEDERGRRRPRSYLVPGQAFGRSALLHGTHHDATLEATQSSCWLYLSREDLDRFNDYTMPDIPVLRRQRWRCAWHRIVERVRAWVQQRAPHPCPGAWYSVWSLLGGIDLRQEEQMRQALTWREPDETVVWQDRQHIWAFFMRFTPFAFLFSAALSLTLSQLLAGSTGSFTAILLAVTLVLALVNVYLIVDYLNDFYAITDRRIIHRERIVLLFESWEEIPLDRVQDVIQTRTLWDRILGTGTIIVQSAAAQGAITMSFVPNPALVRSLLMELRSRTMAKRHAWRRERLRQDLQHRLQVHLHAEWPAVVTGQDYPERLRSPQARAQRQRELTQPDRVPSPGVRRRLRAIGSGLLLPFRLGRDLIARVFFRGRPPPQSGLYVPWQPRTHWYAGGWIYWRKHLFNLMGRLAQPMFMLLLLIPAYWLFFRVLFVDISYAPVRVGLTLVLLLWGLGGLGWLLWRYDDWRNDLYILTPDRLIDIEMKPFFLSEERREAPLNRVQSVRMDRRGLLQNIFNYGDVLIQTAAAEGDLTFEQVVNPGHVVSEINRYLEEFRRRQEEKEYERQQALIAESLEVYDEIIRGRLPRSGRRWRRDDL